MALDPELGQELSTFNQPLAGHFHHLQPLSLGHHETMVAGNCWPQMTMHTANRKAVLLKTSLRRGRQRGGIFNPSRTRYQTIAHEHPFRYLFPLFLWLPPVSNQRIVPDNWGKQH